MRIWIIFMLLLASGAHAQDVWMHPNAGQWDDRINYKVDLQMGEMLIEDDGFTFFLHNLSEFYHKGHEDEDAHQLDHDEDFEAHVVKSKFIGSSWKGNKSDQVRSTHYRNYILGNDKSKWKSHLYSTSKLVMSQMYPGIDLLLDGTQGGLKYSFIIEPGTSPELLQIAYEGQDDLSIDEEGNLHIANRFGEIIESRPVAWTNGKLGRRQVDINFKLTGNTISYELPEGYDTNETLVIDPSLTFSSFSGSTADNWGFTATGDYDANLFGGGVVFGLGYPITVGAYDTTFNAGTIDVAITKFNAAGSALLYSTYLGGSGSETPNSIVSAPNGELFIFGVTSSTNFPMAGSPFDNSFNGGPGIANNLTNNLGFTGGADLYVARLSPDGSTLMASTYVGGSGTDGLNTSNLKFNYGDQFRGEIVLDNMGMVYVASMTESPDFPVVQGSQGSLNGAQDAVVFKMPPTLNSMVWSTYFGGGDIETGNSVEIASNGSVYMAGGTRSGGLFSSGFDLTYDGASDGYLARFNGLTGALMSGTYIGSNEYDQAYFVQIDIDDKVYVLGQTESNLGMTSGLYGNANSGQFINKYNESLTSQLWKTMVGAGTGHVELSPTAFLVSDCFDIYVAGWGGVLNANPNVSQAVNSTTNGFPVTSGTTNMAYQLTTNGSNFWIAVLSQNAATLKYATYFGGQVSSYNHVDGGTSRFDKSGRIYHAVCGACGGNPNGFSTTPGSWSPTNQSSNCNMATFKFELSTIEALISDPNPVVCLPNPVQFTNTSTNGNAFYWDFGDGTSSTLLNPSHVYPGPGTYYGTLIVSDTNGCYTPDSIDFIVTVGDFTGGVINPPGPICPGDSYQLEAFGGAYYQWSPGQFLDDSTSATPTATVDQTTDFMVIISDTCGIDTAYVTLPVFIGTSTITNDTNICIGQSVPLQATGGVSYTWTPSDFLDNPNIAAPTSIPNNTITYHVEIITANGCVLNEEVTINVFFDPPIPVIPDTVNMCLGSSVVVNVSGADDYFWYPNQNLSTTQGPTVTLSPGDSMYYYCDFTNTCGTLTDSVFVAVLTAEVFAFGDTIVCPGESVPLTATGGVYYQWSPTGTLNNSLASSVVATPTQPTVYVVLGTDQNGCMAADSVFVDLFPMPFVQASPDVYAFVGDIIQLSATSSTPGPLTWYPAEYLSCVVCTNPTANPDQEYTYTVSYTDANGCSASDAVTIYYDPIIYVPNTFTPGAGGINPYFKAEGGNINSFEMLIFNRWGELIYTLNSIDEYWDGTYEGAICQDGTYVWKITVTDLFDEEHQYVGHVNLLRE